MQKLKHGDIAAIMMLLWLAICLIFPSRWNDFCTVVACTVPMLVIRQKYRKTTFGSHDCNTVIYKKKEYILFFLFCILGAAAVNAITFLIFKVLGTVQNTNMERGDFLYLLVFSCFLPAFFEEWLVRGGVLGTLAEYKGAGVWLCAAIFALMHMSFQKLPYALFSGVFITALVYLTECIYLGMLLHFLNNFTSLILSYMPSGNYEYITLLAIAAMFVICTFAFKKTKLCKDILNLLSSAEKEQIKEICTPLLLIFAAFSALIMIKGLL